MKISVIYCTARHGGIDILERSMEHQTHDNFEVIVLDELHRTTPFIDVKPPEKKPGMYWNLSASLNEGVRHATGDLIVLLQDYIWVPKDGLAKYAERFEQEHKSIVTGIGHQYKEPSHIDNREGLYSIWENWPGIPCGEKTFIDPRAAATGFHLTIPVEWEANWGSFPRQAWEDIGGFDEDFDHGWGYDNVNFSERCQLAGYHIFADTYNEVLCYDHIRIFGEHKTRDEAPNNQKLWYKKYYDLDRHLSPYRLNYCGGNHG